MSNWKGTLKIIFSGGVVVFPANASLLRRFKIFFFWVKGGPFFGSPFSHFRLWASVVRPVASQVACRGFMRFRPSVRPCVPSRPRVRSSAIPDKSKSVRFWLAFGTRRPDNDHRRKRGEGPCGPLPFLLTRCSYCPSQSQGIRPFSLSVFLGCIITTSSISSSSSINARISFSRRLSNLTPGSVGSFLL